MSKAFRPRLSEDQATHDVVLQFRDGTGDRRQTFTVHYKRIGENEWGYDRITETTLDAL